MCLCQKYFARDLRSIFSNGELFPRIWPIYETGRANIPKKGDGGLPIPDLFWGDFSISIIYYLTSNAAAYYMVKFVILCYQEH